ncbi:MAG: MFS transporter [Actinobacteria bacterium]|nr:MAG: MFS transporter [Actinomycetota bacterium]
MGNNRNITLVVIARLVSRMGGTAAFFIGTWGVAAYTFNATPSQLALMSACAGVAGIIGSAIAGVLIDRFGPRTVMVGAELLTIPVVLALASATSWPVFVALVAVFAGVGIPTFTAGEAFPPYLVREGEPLESVNAWVEGAGSVGFVLGPAVGAIVAKTWDASAVFYVMAAGSVIAALAAWFVRIDVSPREHASGNAARELIEGFRVAYSAPPVRYIIFMGSVMWFGFGFFSALEPLFYRDAVGVGVEWIGWMNTVYGLGLVVGSALLPRAPKRVLSATGLALTIVAVGLGTLAYVGTTQLVTIAIGAAVWGTITGFVGPLLRTLLQFDAPPEYLGRVMGTAQNHRSAGELVPLAFAPALAAAFGVQAVLIGAGIAVALLAAGSVPYARRLDAAGHGVPLVAPRAGTLVDEAEYAAAAIAEEPVHALGDRLG